MQIPRTAIGGGYVSDWERLESLGWGTPIEPMTESDRLRVLALEFPHPKRSAQCYSLSTAFMLTGGTDAIYIFVRSKVIL